MLSLLQPAILGVFGQTFRAIRFLRKVNKRRSYKELNDFRFFAPMVISGVFAISIFLTFSEYPPLSIIAGAGICFITDKIGNILERRDNDG